MGKESNDGAVGLEMFQNVRSKVKVNMLLEKKYVKALDEDGFDDAVDVELEKDVEFGICDFEDETEIKFGVVGTIKVDKAKFDEALKRYLGRNELFKSIR